MNEDKLLEAFVQENSTIAKEIFQKIKNSKTDDYEQIFIDLNSKIKIIKTNASIMNFICLEKLCNGIESIINAVLSKNLILTVSINEFLKNVCNELVKNIGYIKNTNEENCSEIEKLFIDCDRIASGMLLENSKRIEKQNEVQIEEMQDAVISGTRLKEMIDEFEEISIQRSRIRQQLIVLEQYDSLAGIEFTHLRKDISSAVNNLETLLQNVHEQLQETNMIRLSKIVNEFKERNACDDCTIYIEENDVVIDKSTVLHLENILTLLLKNSKEHNFDGIAEPKVLINAKKNASFVELTFADNGNGIDFEELRNNIIEAFPNRKKEILEIDNEGLGMFLFTDELKSFAFELHLVWIEIEKIKGRIKIHSDKGKGTSYTVIFPKSLFSETGFTFKYDGKKYFLPSHYVVESVSKENQELVTDTPKPYFEHRGEKIRIYRLSSILKSEPQKNVSANNNANMILIIEYLELRFGLIVDDVIGFSSKIVKPVPAQLKEIDEVEGIVIDENYDVIPVLNVPSLIKRFTWLREYDLKRTEVAARKIVKNILVVDSSLFARHIVRSIYEANGFFVEEAKDGIEAMQILKNKSFSLIITAVEMPRMNGITLLDNIMRNQQWNKIPIVMFPFESDEETETSYIEMGAKFVIQKNNFDRNRLINMTKGILNE